ncbi:MAG: ATP-binding protein [Phascolarctobacterium sp.]|nr:ATP-binding protein [Phascolarctobacterium sp.]
MKNAHQGKMATVRLVAGEALFNIVTYEYPLEPAWVKYVALAYAAEKDVFMLQLTDGGVPFDPLADWDYFLTRAPWGFGRIFIRHYTDSAVY